MFRFPFPRRAAGVLLSLTLAGCASTSPKEAFRDVARTVEARSGHRPDWDPKNPEDPEVRRAIDRMLEKELTIDAAVQIALLDNPQLRSTFEELSIAQADLVQAGLLKNPTFTIGSTAFEGDAIDPNLFGSVALDFLDLLALPLRKRVAASELEATKLRVADEVLALAADVRAAFYAAQAAEQTVALRKLVREAAEASSELAQRQYAAGNANDLTLASEQALASQVRLDLSRSEMDRVMTRERLNRLLGLWDARIGWRISPKLPELPPGEVAVDKLESTAVSQRLDLAAARHEVEALDRALTLSKTSRWTSFVNVEVEAARRRSDKKIVFGPSASIELPIFDQKQAAIARLEALHRMSGNHLQELGVSVRSDVRSAHARVVAARTMVEEYRKSLVPLRENVVKYSQEQYNAMLIGVYQLLLAKQTEFATYREYIEALRDYWTARSDLERAVGARLAGGAPTSSSSSAAPAPAPAPSAPEPAHAGHHHP